MGTTGCCTKAGSQTTNTVFASTAAYVSVFSSAQSVVKAKRTGLLTDFGEENWDQSSSEKRVKWKLGELIGVGTFGNVYQCLNVETGELLAVKRIRVDHLSAEEVNITITKLKKEVKLLKELAHPNVVRYIGTDIPESGDSIDILTEYVSGGSISSLLKKYAGLSEAVIRSYAEQVLRGLLYLHANRIIHRDLKGANILLTPEGGIKLTDFGSAGTLEAPQDDEEHICFSMIGSPYWMAPEVVLREGHTTKADIWSFGCLLIEMKNGVPPWSDQTKETKTVLKLISSGGISHTATPRLPTVSSDDFRDLVQHCLIRDPLSRQNAEVLLSHRFFTVTK